LTHILGELNNTTSGFGFKGFTQWVGIKLNLFAQRSKLASQMYAIVLEHFIFKVVFGLKKAPNGWTLQKSNVKYEIQLPTPLN
jgi:hypothetical protein